MRALVLTAALSVACASTPRIHTSPDPAAMRAGDGRVALTVASSGATQNVSLVPVGTEATQGMIVDPWCQTPCTLHLRPGEYSLYSGAPAVRDAVTTVRLGDAPHALTLRAPERRGWERGRNLLVGGVGLSVLALIFVGFSPLEVSGGSPTGPETIAVGVGLGAIGVTLSVLGLRAMSAYPTGVETRREP
ncbi:MAG: hypothetical protein U0326_18375 [Polyangiales bacterium]